MAGSNKALFATDSDSDSINTETTVGSEANSDKEYPVEKLLAQQPGPDGQPKYLVKWEGYPLAQCTWESIDNDSILHDWRKEEIAIRRGEKQPFDVDEYNAAYERRREELDEKRERRKAKRRRRGLPVAEDEEDFEPMDIDSSPKAVRPPRTTPQRKGIATPVRKERTGSTQSTKGQHVSDQEESNAASDVPVASTRKRAALKPQKASSAQANKNEASTYQGTMLKQLTKASPAGQMTRNPSTTKQTAFAPVIAKPAQRPMPKDEPPRTTGARKSAPAPPIKPTPAKRLSASNGLGENWDAEKQRRQRPRVSGETPKDSTEPKFRNLSEQNRYQNYSKNEPAPDINALTMFDPKTGKLEPSKTAPPARLGPTDIHSAYSRRSPPPPPKPRSPSVSSLGAEARHTESQAHTLPPAELSSRSDPARPALGTSKGRTCTNWLEGTCVYSAEDCLYAHRVIPGEILPKRYLTCYFWKRGGCTKPIAECEYAHFDTGIDADEPKGFRKRGTSRGPADPNRIPITPRSAADSESVKDASAQVKDSEIPHHTKRSEPGITNSAVWTSKSRTTCYYWWRGHCNKSQEECPFAHRDTGVYAGPPGSYLESRRKSLSFRGAGGNDSGPRRAVNDSNASDSTFFSPPPAAIAHNTDAFAPFPYRAQEPAQQTEQVSFIADVPMTGSPIADLTNHMAPRSPFIGSANVISPAKDPRRQPRHRESTVSSREVTMSEASHPSDHLRDDAEMARSGVAKLDFTSMLGNPGSRQGLVEYVYIHMPEDRIEERKILREYLDSLEGFVFNVQEGKFGWRDFMVFVESGRRSLLVIHPCEFYNGTISKLRSIVAQGNARIFSVGVQHGLCLREYRPPAYEALCLFPLGGITFISDDVFIYYPEKATEIINLFLEQTRNKPPGAETYKIGARPGIKDWMSKVASQKFDEQVGNGKAMDIRWIACYEALCRLCPPEDEDPDYDPHHVPLESSHLWSVWEDSMPSLQDRWESGDEEGTTDYMVNLFAGEACSKAWKYRRFYFVYQRPEDAQEATDSPAARNGVHVPVKAMMWMEKYNHISVKPPDWVLKTMRRN